MPIGPYKTHTNGFSNSPQWFNELWSMWNQMETVPLSEIRSQAAKRSKLYLDKAYHFLPESIPNKFGLFTSNSEQTWFRNVLASYFESRGLKSTEHFHISFIETNDEDYRKPDTPRICYVWKCSSQGNIIDRFNSEILVR